MMIKNLALLLLPLSLVSCSLQAPKGADKEGPYSKPKTITLKELKERKNSTYVKVSCRISGVNVEHSPTRVEQGRFQSMQAPSVLMTLNEKKPPTVEIVREHLVPSDPKALPISGMTHTVTCKLDEKTGNIIHSGKAMVSVRNPDEDGVMSFSQGLAYWGEESSSEKKVTTYVKDQKITFHFTFTLMDATGLVLKVVDK